MILKHIIDHPGTEGTNRLTLEPTLAGNAIIIVRESNGNLCRFWVDQKEAKIVAEWFNKFAACVKSKHHSLGNKNLNSWCTVIISTDDETKKVEIHSGIHNKTVSVPWAYGVDLYTDVTILTDPPLVSRAIEVFGTSIFE